MKTVTFHRKDGTLNAYALACGYKEIHETKYRYIELYREHTVYHVRSFQIEGGNHNRISWDTFNTLRQAYTRFNQLGNQANLDYANGHWGLSKYELNQRGSFNNVVTRDGRLKGYDKGEL